MQIYDIHKLSEGLNSDAHYTTWTTELIYIKLWQQNQYAQNMCDPISD